MEANSSQPASLHFSPGLIYFIPLSAETRCSGEKSGVDYPRQTFLLAPGSPMLSDHLETTTSLKGKRE